MCVSALRSEINVLTCLQDSAPNLTELSKCVEEAETEAYYGPDADMESVLYSYLLLGRVETSDGRLKLTQAGNEYLRELKALLSSKGTSDPLQKA